MLRHNAFFNFLGSIAEQDSRWPSALAGLTVLRLVDVAAKERAPDAATEWTGIGAGRKAVEAIDPHDATRSVLLRLVDCIENAPFRFADIGMELLHYGRALDLTAQWDLASDVFLTITDVSPARDYPRLHIEALTARGAAERNLTNWEKSARSYALAHHLADAIGDRVGSLTVRVGLAGNSMVRGNLPAAEEELKQTLAEASAHGLHQVEAIALHAMASVAHSRGDYQHAIHLAYRSLELTTNCTSRDRLLSDIAAAYAGLGMRDVARNGYSIVANTSPHQWVRWQATLNLMELAVAEGIESRFDELEANLESANLDPRLHAYFLMFRAVGASRFGREHAINRFVEARDFAARHQLYQIEFEVNKAMNSVNKLNADEPGQPAYRTGVDSGGELKRIAEMLTHFREQATG